MKTLRELGIEPTDELKGWEGRDSALDLTPRQAADIEIMLRCCESPGSISIRAVASILAHYGGRIVFEGDSERDAKTALRTLLHLIDSAGGPGQLSKAVVLGEISWMVKMSSAIEYAQRLLDGGDSDDK